MNKQEISKRFKTFAEMECRDSSPLYEYLSIKIADDDELLELCTYCRDGQPVPNLFLGGVHFLLMNGSSHHLRNYYPSIVQDPLPVKKSFNHFKQFCLLNKHQLIPILQTKLVQTNEVRRCAYLYPAFCYMHELTNKPLALMEIGTSAGLQLGWDQYRYQYDIDDGEYGNNSSSILISSEVKGNHHPVLYPEPPPVASRTGYDLHINHKEDHPWLLSLIWPEHEERRSLFTAAAESIKELDIDFIEGDGIEHFPEKIKEIPDNEVICIFHTHVANQIPESAKRVLHDKIKEIGRHRNIFHLYNNMWDRQLHLDCYINGKEDCHLIGDTDGHGRWFEWNLLQEKSTT
ncbi:hypothetical protein AS034_11805 [[Bacillus] enclensis]|uniref:DUF2332 domain-containing protein n=1 Tax=[Bacillus] enclensis TaxID=1402860 RepID=A0A0V8HJM5_9BACI|nr:DUF2332 domain-containing protein [[Bacillus] enclensis]KSU62780.1 hypothetical protein AS034_11805 [[Bacillus] enclensis]SCC09459.1 hypothetical protein GA0061094_2447 [[Bacillus] enclensis]